MRMLTRITGLAGIVAFACCAISAIYRISGFFPAEGGLVFEFVAKFLLICALGFFAVSLVSWLARREATYRETLFPRISEKPDFGRRAGLGLGAASALITSYFPLAEHFPFKRFIVLLALGAFFVVFAVAQVVLSSLWHREGMEDFRKSCALRGKRRKRLRHKIIAYNALSFGVLGIALSFAIPSDCPIEQRLYAISRMPLYAMLAIGLWSFLSLVFTREESENEAPKVAKTGLAGKILSAVWTLGDFGAPVLLPPVLFTWGMTYTRGAVLGEHFWRPAFVALLVSMHVVIFLKIIVPKPNASGTSTDNPPEKKL